MDRADRCRRAAVAVVDDVEPAPLRETIEAALGDASMTPAVLTVATARTLSGDGDSFEARLGFGPDATDRTGGTGDSSVPVTPLAERAAGVQLIYEGLGLIRTLAREEPWAGLVTADGDPVPDERLTGDNLRTLAADVAVSRGFSLLARTAAARRAVETVRAFGRDQTARPDADPDRARRLDAELERDALELAAVAGAGAVDADPAPVLALAGEWADAGGVPLGPPGAVLPTDADLDRIVADYDGGDGEGGEGGVLEGGAERFGATTATDP